VSTEWAAAAHWGIEVLVEQRLLPGWLPLARASVLTRLGRNGRIAGQVSFGGFGGWRAGARYDLELQPGLVLQAALPNLLGSAGDRMRGLAASMGLAWKW
jgi:hypothetical protein